MQTAKWKILKIVDKFKFGIQSTNILKSFQKVREKFAIIYETIYLEKKKHIFSQLKYQRMLKSILFQ